ncbi:MAG: type II secretion system protein GspG, partial [Oricola sp.]
FMQRGGIYDDLRTKLAEQQLNSLVMVIEFHRVLHGEYPPSLEAMQEAMQEDARALERAAAYDPRPISPFGQSAEHFFYYSKVDDSHYYLRAVGPDGKPWSEGSFGPVFTQGQGTLGLLTGPPKQQ